MGICEASQPPPRARTSSTLEAKRRVLEVGLGALVLDQSGFGGEDFKVAGDAAFVALVGEVEGVLGGGTARCSAADSCSRMRRSESWSSTSLKARKTVPL